MQNVYSKVISLECYHTETLWTDWISDALK